jgi:hypothetical protein
MDPLLNFRSNGYYFARKQLRDYLLADRIRPDSRFLKPVVGGGVGGAIQPEQDILICGICLSDLRSVRNERSSRTKNL